MWASRWLLNLRGRPLDIRVMVERLKPGLRNIGKIIRRSMTEEEIAQLESQMQPYMDGGFPRKLAEWTVMLDRLFPALEVVETAASRRSDVNRIASVFFGLGDALELKWLRRQVEALAVGGQWHAISRANLRDELFTQHNRLVECVLQVGGRKRDPLAAWLSAHSERVGEVQEVLRQMRKEGGMDYATLSVAVRSLAQLADDTG